MEINLRPTTLVIFLCLSPTALFAIYKKELKTREERTVFIECMNYRYLFAAVCLAGLIFYITNNQPTRAGWLLSSYITIPATWYFISRCNEVFYAFYKDAFDKLELTQIPRSTLTWSTRVKLALNSYIELILNFSFMYAMLPQEMWQPGNQRPKNYLEFLYYSALTITTSGGGGFAANHWIPQILTVYEVMCGLILLVVSFTIYTSRAMGDARNVKTKK